MIIKPGEKIHVIIRRRFESDLRRHFIGEVTATTDNALLVAGHVFVLDMGTNRYARRPELRTRVVSLTDSGNIINLLPAAADVANTVYEVNADKRMVVTDNQTFSLDINEFGTMT
jgi:hypothetical protein